MSKTDSEKVEAKREIDTGKYIHKGGWERLCTCGHTLGVHAAEKAEGQRPCFAGDHGQEICDCEVFKPAKRAKV